MTLTEFFSNFKAILPIVMMFISAAVLLLAGLWIPPWRRWIAPLFAAVSMLAALVLLFWPARESTWAFGQMVLADGFSVYLSALFLVSGLVAIGLSVDYFKCAGECRTEYYVLLLISIAGMMLMTVAADLIIFFLALELLSLPLYVMAGSACRRSESEEAALKYFLMGAFAGGFVLYGVALIFGATGSTGLTGIINAYQSGVANLTLLVAGAALILVGLGFKVAAVPFHMWTPDVYQGAPAPVTAFMSVGAKAAGFTVLVRLFLAALMPMVIDLSSIFWIMSALTMLFGNLVALPQNNLKRLLAYSSIAHAGYMLMPLTILGQNQLVLDAVASILFYLVVYALASFTAWAVVIAVEKEDGSGVNVDDLAGLARKSPWMAASMAIAMLSLMGMPPMLGFVGKLYLFGTVVSSGQISLALVGLLATLISAAYYLRVIVVMYMREGNPEIHDTFWLKLISTVMAAATLILPIVATPLFTWLWRLVFGAE